MVKDFYLNCYSYTNIIYITIYTNGPHCLIVSVVNAHGYETC